MNDYPRNDTLRKKRKIIREVKRTVRHINKDLRKDVYGDHFSVVVLGNYFRPWEDHSGWNCGFRIEFRDAKYPDRNYSYWFDPYFIVYSGFFAGGRHVDTDLNDFIVKSDFWENYKAEKNSKVEK